MGIFSGNKKDFLKHLTWFLSVHFIIILLIKTEINTFSFLNSMVANIKEGKIGWYEENSGIFVIYIWAIVLAADGFFVFRKSKQ
ncbi:2TM domain-containing protein [Paenibacillus eucommiae]|uniref:Uncharacterized protein n=1 Tax=Paenibacillus eucommiae TaxID=1355755 RepID=A0ABS4JAV1_9BACL|nr:2TM domain-containing protein [Paenibacillus eucommiae]MBP1996963.1 hypothetical protein [Paenibacillus eucommiae]